MLTMIPPPLNHAALADAASRTCANCRFYAVHAEALPSPYWCARRGEWLDGDPTETSCGHHARSDRR